MNKNKYSHKNNKCRAFNIILFLITVLLLNLSLSIDLIVPVLENKSIILFAQSVLEQKYKLGESYEKGGDFESAVRLYEEIYKESKHEKYFTALLRLYKLQNRFQEANQIIEEQLKIKKSLNLLIAHGEVNWQLGLTSVANSSWAEALSLYSDDADTYSKLSNTLNSLRLFDKSISILKEAKKKFPSNLSFSDGLSRLYIINGNYSDGLEEVIYILEMNKDLQLAQGKIFALMNSPEAIEYINKTFQKKIKQSDNTLILLLYAWYLRANKEFAKALEIFSELDSRQKDKGSQLYRFAEDSRRDGEYDVALEAYQRIINMGTKTNYLNSALFAHAKTMEEKLLNNSSLSREDAAKIIKNYNNIISKYPKTQYSEESKLRVAYLQNIILEKPKEALQTLQDIVKTNYNSLYSVRAMYFISEIYIQIDSLDACNNILKTIINNYGRQTSNMLVEKEVAKSKFLQAELYFYNKNIDSALAIYEKLSENTASEIANYALEKVSLINQNKDFIKALGLISQAELCLKQKKIKTAGELYKEASQLHPGEQISEKASIQYAELEIQQNNLDIASEFLNKYIDSNISPLYGDNAIFLLGNISEKQKKIKDAISYYTDLLVKYPRSIFVIESRKRIKELRETL